MGSTVNDATPLHSAAAAAGLAYAAGRTHNQSAVVVRVWVVSCRCREIAVRVGDATVKPLVAEPIASQRRVGTHTTRRREAVRLRPLREARPQPTQSTEQWQRIATPRPPPARRQRLYPTTDDSSRNVHVQTPRQTAPVQRGGNREANPHRER